MRKLIQLSLLFLLSAPAFAENADRYKPVHLEADDVTLDDLRKLIGDEAFFAFLQEYVRQQYGRIATANDFFSLLRLHAGVDFSDLQRAYFQNVY